MASEHTTGTIIKNALRRLGRTQGWLANEMDVSDAAVSKWIRKGTIAREHIAGLADLLEVPASTLLSGQNARTEQSEETIARTRHDVRLDTLTRVLVALAHEFGPDFAEALRLVRTTDQRATTNAMFHEANVPPRSTTSEEERISYAGESGTKNTFNNERP